MFTHPQPPTTLPFEGGYVCFMRLLSISNMVMAKLWQDHAVRTGMHVKYDDQGNPVISLYLLGLTPKDQRIASLHAMALISDLHDDLLFQMSTRNEQPMSRHFSFLGTDGTPEENNVRITSAIVEEAFASIQALYSDPAMDNDHVETIQTAADGSFMKKVASVSVRGRRELTDYETHFSDGTAIRYSMNSDEGDKILPGDWLYHDRQCSVKRIANTMVN